MLRCLTVLFVLSLCLMVTAATGQALAMPVSAPSPGQLSLVETLEVEVEEEAEEGESEEEELEEAEEEELEEEASAREARREARRRHRQRRHHHGHGPCHRSARPRPHVCSHRG
jgi:hypothetical protein